MLRPIAWTLTASLCLVVTSECGIAFGADSDWTGWLGPQRNGWVTGFQPPGKWPEQLKKSWQATVGTGYGSPLVSGGRAYQHARQGEQEVVWCLDLATGSVKWRKSYTVPFKMGGGGESHGKGPKSCPTLADGRLFTLSITGVLSAWDATSGNLLWRRDYSTQFKQTHPNWGVTTSPLVDGNRVIVHFGNDDQGVLVALHVENGEEVWKQGKDGASYASPLLAGIHDVDQVVEWNHRVVAGIDSKSGDLLWEFPFPHVGTDQNMPSPAFHKGRVLVGGENRGILSLEPQLKDGVWSVKQRWHQKEVALDMSSAVVNGDKLYGFSHYGKGRIFCLDTDTGKVLWQGPGRTGQNATFLSIPGHVLALINNGELQVIRADDDKYKVAAVWQVAETPTWAPPVLLEGGVLIKDRDTLSFWSFKQ